MKVVVGAYQNECNTIVVAYEKKAPNWLEANKNYVTRTGEDTSNLC